MAASATYMVSHAATPSDISAFAAQVANSAVIDGSLNVQSFGAQGDGWADDTSAIQRAIDAAFVGGGGALYFPRGVYQISRTLILKYRVSIAGLTPIPPFDAINDSDLPSGAFPTIVLAPNANCTMLENDRKNGPIQQGSQRWQRSSIQNLHFFGNCNWQFRGLYHGIDIDEAWGVTICGIQVSKTRGHGIRLHSCNAIRIENSNIILTDAAQPGASCLYIDDLADSAIGPCNQFGGSPGSVVYVTTGQSAHPKAWLFQVHSNLLFNSVGGYGVEIVNNPWDSGISVQGNRVDQNFLGGIRAENSPAVLISGNVAVLNGLKNPEGQEGISLLTSPRCIVSSNMAMEMVGGIKENQAVGIEVGRDCDYTVVASNMTRPNDVAQITVDPAGNDNVRLSANPGVQDR